MAMVPALIFMISGFCHVDLHLEMILNSELGMNYPQVCHHHSCALFVFVFNVIISLKWKLPFLLGLVTVSRKLTFTHSGPREDARLLVGNSLIATC